MRGVHPAGGRIDHLFAVAVVGSDQELAAERDRTYKQLHERALGGPVADPGPIVWKHGSGTGAIAGGCTRTW